MYTVIRNYTGAPTLASDLKAKAKEVEAVIRPVSGFIAYYLIQTNGGAASVTVCETQAGCDESTKLASDWLRQNLPNLKTAAPQIIAGELALKFATYKTANV